jgi:hypothetical protein
MTSVITDDAGRPTHFGFLALSLLSAMPPGFHTQREMRAIHAWPIAGMMNAPLTRLWQRGLVARVMYPGESVYRWSITLDGRIAMLRAQTQTPAHYHIPRDERA